MLLTVVGLVLNIIGAYKLYRSIMSYPEYYQKPGQKKNYPIAVLNINAAKDGIILLIVGTIFQLLAVFIPICTNPRGEMEKNSLCSSGIEQRKIDEGL